MKARFIFLFLALAFIITLAVVIGQRLSSEAMAVMVGVIAGVAASIPTSLLVVWFANRALYAARPPVEAPSPEPRPMMMMAPPNAYQYAPPGMAMPQYPPGMSYPPNVPYALQPMPPAPRNFTVIGGGEALEPTEPPMESPWPR